MQHGFSSNPGLNQKCQQTALSRFRMTDVQTLFCSSCIMPPYAPCFGMDLMDFPHPDTKPFWRPNARYTCADNLVKTSTSESILFSCYFRHPKFKLPLSWTSCSLIRLLIWVQLLILNTLFKFEVSNSLLFELLFWSLLSIHYVWLLTFAGVSEAIQKTYDAKSYLPLFLWDIRFD